MPLRSACNTQAQRIYFAMTNYMNDGAGVESKVIQIMNSLDDNLIELFLQIWYARRIAYRSSKLKGISISLPSFQHLIIYFETFIKDLWIAVLAILQLKGNLFFFISETLYGCQQLPTCTWTLQRTDEKNC